MQPDTNIPAAFLKASLSPRNNWRFLGIASLLCYSASALAAPPAATGSEPSHATTPLPPACYLDIPGVPEENGLNKLLLSMDDHGVKPILQYYGDFLANPVGGKAQSADWFQLLVYGVNLDLERLVGWKGGEFTLTAIDTGGNDIENNVGTLFTPAQAVTLRGSALFKLYFTQHLFDDKLEFKIGRTSAGSLYARLPMSGITVGGAVNGNPLSLFYNVSGFRMAGRASWMANVKVRPTKDTYLQSGIFQVSTDRMDRVWYHGVDFSMRRGDGVLLMSEAGWTPTFGKEESPSATRAGKQTVQNAAFAGLPGIYELGGYYQNYPMPTFLGNNSVQNEFGFYCQGQQMVWRSRTNENHNFTIWGGMTYSPQTAIACLPVMAYGGLDWAGLFPDRDQDQLLLNCYIGGYSHDYSLSYSNQGKGSRTMETVFELSYIFQLTRQIQFQPDLQWFIQPGGAKSIPNALVLGFQVSFVY